MHVWSSLASLITAAPLLLFRASTQRLPLITVEMLRYIAPTITLLIAVSIYGETFAVSHATGFGCVWFGLVTLAFDSIRRADRLAQNT